MHHYIYRSKKQIGIRQRSQVQIVKVHVFLRYRLTLSLVKTRLYLRINCAELHTIERKSFSPIFKISAIHQILIDLQIGACLNCVCRSM